MNILVIGCDQVGASLIRDLERIGHDISLIERDPEQLKRLDAFDDYRFGGTALVGDPTDPDVLRRGGVENCDAVAAVSEDDSVNLMAAQIAKSIFRREKKRQRLSAVIAYTEAHYRENIALSDAAATLHMHPNSFCRFFKENTGVTYLNYLNEYRLSKVYEDLVTTDVALHEILEKHGFTNYKLFRHMFAERFHTTPGRMREELREGSSSK